MSAPAAAGLAYSASAYWRASTIPRSVAVGIEFWDSRGSLLSTTLGTSITDNLTTWVQGQVTATAPLGAVTQTVLLDVIGAAAGELHYADAIQLETGTTANPYAAPGIEAYAAEKVQFAPDGTGIFNRIWVIGATQSGPSQTYNMNQAFNGAAYTFPLPSKLRSASTLSVTVAGADQGGVGILGVDGTLDNPAAWTKNVLISYVPSTIAFKTPPTAGQAVILTGTFTYPLIQIVSDDAGIAKAGGLVFEKALRDKRITSTAEALAVGQAHLRLESSAKSQGSCTIYQRANSAGMLLEPGHSITLSSRALFRGGVLPGGATSVSILVTKVSYKLTEDMVQPWELNVSFSNRPEGSDDGIMDVIIGEQGRVNAALDQSDVATIVSDIRTLFETGQATDSMTQTNVTTQTATYDSTFLWDYATYSA